MTDFVGVDEKAGRVYYRSTEASPLERQLYSVRLDGGEKRRITAGAGTHRIVDGSRVQAGFSTFIRT